MNKLMKLSQLCCGENAEIFRLENDEPTKCRLKELGVCENTQITCLFSRHGKGGHTFLINGAVIALNEKDTSNIYIAKEMTGWK